MERYFIVTYENEKGMGHACTVTEGTYLNANKFIKDIKEQGYEQVVIKNIIELSKQDFIDYTKV